MRKIRYFFALLLAVAALSTGITSHTADALAPVIRWDFNEASASHPSNPAGLTATSGNLVTNTGQTILMPYVSNWKTAYLPGRLTRVPENDILDPGTGDFLIEVTYRTTRSWGNLIQKGQNGTPGGYFKIELPEGNVTCLFKDANGVQRAVRSAAKFNDGNWHTIRCLRAASGGITLWVDGQVHGRNANRTGNINNSIELTIAGKRNCTNQPNQTSCDYFVGEVDSVSIEK